MCLWGLPLQEGLLDQGTCAYKTLFDVAKFLSTGSYYFASLAAISEVSLPNRVLCQTFGFCYYDIWEKALAPHSSTLAWKIPWMEAPGRLQTTGSLWVRHDWTTSFSLFTFMHWRRKCNPLQCSCLENPRDGGAWWASVYEK